MIKGNGDIASVLPDKKNLLFFASGVSDSSEVRESEFRRELDLLALQDKKAHIVYFSTLSVFYGDTPYTRHKRKMEMVIQVAFPKYTIIRIGNISWGKNPHTLINYLKAHPKAEIQDVYRYIVSKDEFLHWIDMIPPWSCEMNIPGERLKVAEIAKRIKEKKL